MIYTQYGWAFMYENLHTNMNTMKYTHSTFMTSRLEQTNFLTPWSKSLIS